MAPARLNIAEVRQLARQLQVYRGDPDWDAANAADPDREGTGAVVLIGAGCSRTAGIPLAGDIAQTMAKRLARRFNAGDAQCESADDALTWLMGQGEMEPDEADGRRDWGHRYAELFTRHFTADGVQRDIIRAAVAQGEGRINWAHVCLGELVDKHYVHTVLTTNFDQLVAKGIILTGRLPVIADGIEALTRVASRPADPQVVYLHGSMHTYSPRNSRGAVAETSDALPMQGTMWGILREAPLLVVVGYAGKEEGVVELLVRAGREMPNLVVYWVAYEPDASSLSPAIEDFLSGPNKFLIPGQDADSFFAELMREMGEPIAWIVDPLLPLTARKSEIARPAVEEVHVLLDEYDRRLERMREQAEDSAPEDRLARAAMDTLSGKDEKVVDALGEEPAVDARAERLLAGSLLRTGDAAQDASRLRRSIALWREQIAKGGHDGTAYLRLGDALQALGDIEETAGVGPPEGQPVEDLRGDSIEAYEMALDATPREANATAWREARAGYATAVLQYGSEGADLARLDRAIACLRELLEAGEVGPTAAGRGMIYDKLSMLHLMRAYRTGERTDFQDAVEASEQALLLAGTDHGSTGTAVVRRNLAAALRGLGENSRQLGHEQEGLDDLRRAGALYRAAADEYLAGVRDADRHGSTTAAIGSLEEARDIFLDIGSNEDAAEVIAMLANLGVGEDGGGVD